MRLGKLGRAISVGMMLGGMLFLAACPGDLEEAAEEATKADKAAVPQQTLDECLEECQQVADKQEADCVAQLTDEERVDPEAYDSPVLACNNEALGDMAGCQVECNMADRQRRQ